LDWLLNFGFAVLRAEQEDGWWKSRGCQAVAVPDGKWCASIA